MDENNGQGIMVASNDQPQDSFFNDFSVPSSGSQASPPAPPAPQPADNDPFFNGFAIPSSNEQATDGQSNTGRNVLSDAIAGAAGAYMGRKAGKWFPYNPTVDKDQQSQYDLLQKADSVANQRLNAMNDVANAKADVQTAHQNAAQYDIYSPSNYDEFVNHPEVNGAINANFVNNVGGLPAGGIGTYNYGRAFGLTHKQALSAMDMTKNKGGVHDIINTVNSMKNNTPSGYEYDVNTGMFVPLNPNATQANAGASQVAQQQLNDSYTNLKNAINRRDKIESMWDKIEPNLTQPQTDAYNLNLQTGQSPNLAGVAPALSTAQKVARFVSPTMGGLSAGLGAMSAYNAFTQGRPVEGAIDTTGALGGVLSMIPRAGARLLGGALQAPMLGYDIYQAARRGMQKDIETAKQQGKSPLQYAREKATAGPFGQ